MWNFLQESFTLGDEHRKMILKNRINFLKFNINDDIHIYLATLQNMLDELEIIDSDISDNTKVGIINRALPENLRWINVFQFNNNWKECCNYLKRIVQTLRSLILKKKKFKKKNLKAFFIYINILRVKLEIRKENILKERMESAFSAENTATISRIALKIRKLTLIK